MKRCIVIQHDIFDCPGKGGIEQAKNIIDEMKKGNEQCLRALVDQNAHPEMISKTKEFLSGLRYYIRKLDL